MAETLRADQLAPHSVDAEEALLGGVIADDQQWATVSYVMPEHFFIVRHQWIWEALGSLRRQGKAIDYLTVVSELENKGRLSEIGGAAYVLRLISAFTPRVYIESYAAIVYEHAIRRQLIKAASEIVRAAHSEMDYAEIVTEAERAVVSVTRQADTGREVRGIREVARDESDVTLAMLRGERQVGVATGLADLDGVTRFADGNLIIIAARPGMGKTALLLTMLANIQTQCKVGLMSMEMTEREIIRRLVVMQSGIPFARLQQGTLDKVQVPLYLEVMGKIAEWNVMIDDTSRLTPQTFTQRVQRMVLEHDVRVVMVDYLQLMRAPEYARQGRVAEVTAISQELKTVARDFGIVVIAACQLSRAVEQRPDKRPMLSDLRESGSIEQDADQVLMVYRDEYYNQPSLAPGIAELALNKNRNGATGLVRTQWEGTRMTFRNLDDTW